MLLRWLKGEDEFFFFRIFFLGRAEERERGWRCMYVRFCFFAIDTLSVFLSFLKKKNTY